MPELVNQHLGTSLTRRALDQSNQRLDLRPKLHQARSHLCLVSTDQKRTGQRSGNTAQCRAGKSANDICVVKSASWLASLFQRISDNDRSAWPDDANGLKEQSEGCVGEFASGSIARERAVRNVSCKAVVALSDALLNRMQRILRCAPRDALNQTVLIVYRLKSRLATNDLQAQPHR